MKKFKTPLLVSVVATLIILALYAFKPTATKVTPPQPLAVPVEALSVQRQNFQVLIRSQGLVEATTQAPLSAQIRGNIIARSADFERGGRFNAGDVLITVDDRDYLAALKLAQANVSKARVALEQEQARSEAAISDWRRLGFEEPPADLAARRPQVEAAEAELESASAVVEKAQLDLSRTRIKAPFDGRVIGDTINLGSYVTPGKVLGSVVEIDQLKVALPVSAHWRGMFSDSSDNKLSDAITITLPANAGAQWQATIRNTSATVSLDSRQFFIIADVDVASARQNNVELLIGDYVDAVIKGRVLSNVFVIPRNALYEERFVWLVMDNKLYKRTVETLWKDADVAVVDEGIQPGEHVVITPMGMSAVSGTAVTVLPDVANASAYTVDLQSQPQ